jgi:hypothetical protein
MTMDVLSAGSVKRWAGSDANPLVQNGLQAELSGICGGGDSEAEKEEEMSLHRVQREFTVTGSQLVTADCPLSAWQYKAKRCKFCNQPFAVGSSITIAFYKEHGRSYSGGVHTECLEASRVPELKGEEDAAREEVAVAESD